MCLAKAVESLNKQLSLHAVSFGLNCGCSNRIAFQFVLNSLIISTVFTPETRRQLSSHPRHCASRFSAPAPGLRRPASHHALPYLRDHTHTAIQPHAGVREHQPSGNEKQRLEPVWNGTLWLIPIWFTMFPKRATPYIKQLVSYLIYVPVLVICIAFVIVCAFLYIFPLGLPLGRTQWWCFLMVRLFLFFQDLCRCLLWYLYVLHMIFVAFYINSFFVFHHMHPKHIHYRHY